MYYTQKKTPKRGRTMPVGLVILFLFFGALFGVPAIMATATASDPLIVPEGSVMVGSYKKWFRTRFEAATPGHYAGYDEDDYSQTFTVGEPIRARFHVEVKGCAFSRTVNRVANGALLSRTKLGEYASDLKHDAGSKLDHHFVEVEMEYTFASVDAIIAAIQVIGPHPIEGVFVEEIQHYFRQVVKDNRPTVAGKAKKGFKGWMKKKMGRDDAPKTSAHLTEASMEEYSVELIGHLNSTGAERGIMVTDLRVVSLKQHSAPPPGTIKRGKDRSYSVAFASETTWSSLYWRYFIGTMVALLMLGLFLVKNFRGKIRESTGTDYGEGADVALDVIEMAADVADAASGVADIVG